MAKTRSKKAAEKLPEPVKIDSRICFTINYFRTKEEAARYAAFVRRQGYTYNGGWFHGRPCGREETWDHTDKATGERLYAVTS